jgi:hypothetical protein
MDSFAMEESRKDNNSRENYQIAIAIFLVSPSRTDSHTLPLGQRGFHAEHSKQNPRMP